MSGPSRSPGAWAGVGFLIPLYNLGFTPEDVIALLQALAGFLAVVFSIWRGREYEGKPRS